MDKIAFVFSGQGDQYPGMGKELYEKSAVVRGLFDQANQILGFNIKKIIAICRIFIEEYY